MIGPTLYATEELRQRIALLAGSPRKHVKWVYDRTKGGHGSREWIRACLSGRKATPWGLAVALVRLAEESPRLSSAEAWEFRHKWFKEDERP